MSLSVAIVIATRGRPKEVSNLLNALALQTVAPELIVVSACDQGDVDLDLIPAKNIEILFGDPGLTAQRNRALSIVYGNYDIVVFFDDDFIPSRFWIERIQFLFAVQVDLCTVTGQVLVDGVKVGGITWQEGQAIVDRADALK